MNLPLFEGESRNFPTVSGTWTLPLLPGTIPAPHEATHGEHGTTLATEKKRMERVVEYTYDVYIYM